MTLLFNLQFEHSKRLRRSNGPLRGSPAPDIGPCLLWSVLHVYCMIINLFVMLSESLPYLTMLLFQKWPLSSHQSPFAITPGLQRCKSNLKPQKKVRAENHVHFIICLEGFTQISLKVLKQNKMGNIICVCRYSFRQKTNCSWRVFNLAIHLINQQLKFFDLIIGFVS